VIGASDPAAAAAAAAAAAPQARETTFIFTMIASLAKDLPSTVVGVGLGLGWSKTPTAARVIKQHSPRVIPGSKALSTHGRVGLVVVLAINTHHYYKRRYIFTNIEHHQRG